MLHLCSRNAYKHVVPRLDASRYIQAAPIEGRHRPEACQGSHAVFPAFPRVDGGALVHLPVNSAVLYSCNLCSAHHQRTTEDGMHSEKLKFMFY